MAARLGAKEVIILEPNSSSRKTMEMFVEANYLSKQVQIVDSLDNLPIKKKVDIVFGEPSFVTSILPWDNLRFWYLSSSYFVGAEKFPISAAIRGVAMEFKDLHKIRSPLGICEGFHLSSFDKFVQVLSLNLLKNVLLYFQFYANKNQFQLLVTAVIKPNYSSE